MFLDFVYSQYVGIFDIIIIVGFILAIILGIKKGFLTKMINIANALFGLLFAVFFCVKFANACLYPWFGEKIQQSFYTNIMANETFASIQTADDAINVLNKLGIPNFISKMIVNSSNTGVTNYVQSVATNFASIATTVVLVVISFLILFFGTTLICFILKLFVKLLRESKFVKVIDGILGLVLYSMLFYIILQLVFFIIILIYNKAGFTGFNDFVTCDILGRASEVDPNLKNAGFRMSQWFFENNFLGNLVGLLF